MQSEPYSWWFDTPPHPHHRKSVCEEMALHVKNLEKYFQRQFAASKRINFIVSFNQQLAEFFGCFFLKPIFERISYPLMQDYLALIYYYTNLCLINPPLDRSFLDLLSGNFLIGFSWPEDLQFLCSIYTSIFRENTVIHVLGCALLLILLCSDCLWKKWEHFEEVWRVS